jgi:hypothetical protein
VRTFDEKRARAGFREVTRHRCTRRTRANDGNIEVWETHR